MTDISPCELSDSDDLSQTSDLFCTVERAASPESVESDKEELRLSRKSSVTTVKVPTEEPKAPTACEESAVEVAEYNLVYDAELWKLISHIRDPQYAGETFSSKTGFMQFICSKIEYGRSVSDDELDDSFKVQDEQEANVLEPPSETRSKFTTDTTQVNIAQSPPPMLEHIFPSGAVPYRQTKYMFEMTESITRHDEREADVSMSVAEDNDLCYSPDSAEYRPMTPDSAMQVEVRASSPESVTSVNEFRALSPDSPLPEFRSTLPECITFLRSASYSPENVASDTDDMPLDFEFTEWRASSPESAQSEDQNEKDRSLSPQSEPEYRPMSLESAMYMVDKRASSPESMTEHSVNRSLSPDSPVLQFMASLDTYTTTIRSSSPESVGSYSECEFIVTSSRTTDTERPSSPESISSVSEFRRLMPDSPVPMFMRILSSYFMDVGPSDRSSSPVSLTSESEFVALPVDYWMDDSPRPLSPQSIESEEESGLYCTGSLSTLVSRPGHLSHVTSTSSPEQTLSGLHKTTSEALSEGGPASPNWSKMTQSEYEDWLQFKSMTRSYLTSQTTVCDKDSPVKRSQGVKGTEEETPQRASQASDETQEASELGALSTNDSESLLDKLRPLQLPDHSSYTTHRTVTPVLPSYEKKSHSFTGDSDWELPPNEAQSSELFSPMSSQFLIPPDYEAVFSGHQTLRVSECSQASLNDLSPVSPVFSNSAQIVTEDISKESGTLGDFEFSPDFNRVLSEFEKTASEFESEQPKVLPKKPRKDTESPQHSDSDVEFYDCRQALSDYSDPEEPKLDHELYYHISEPPSPMPGSSPDVGFLRRNPQYRAQPFLRVEDYKRFSSGSESLGEFAYDSDSRECRAEGNLPMCEELPSRDQAGYYDDDDFLGRVRG
ncbi:uncharacterized protein LOC115438315 [Sphaeramia orbicularis]|uniref:uncharacterized protein LOC115438315 n=1 Tax=Sphaeramia orbicularis TaxID=375764 RepID=UPI00117E084D|nr:uncharacterized protein LOC115438315 [Sphaeramia orbicularis]